MDLWLISTGFPLLGIVSWKIRQMHRQAQLEADKAREAYELIYPRGTTDAMVLAFLQSLGGGLRRRSALEIPTLVSEVRWTASDVRHILRIPGYRVNHVLGLVDAHLPGASVNPIEVEDISPTLAVDVSMTNSQRLLRFNRDTIRTLSASILHSVPHIRDGEVVVYQVIMSHTSGVKLPSDAVTKANPSLVERLSGNVQADKHEISDRQKKAVEQNYNVAIRIAAQSTHEIRAKELIADVLTKLRSVESNDVKLKAKILTVGRGNDETRSTDIINLATTPAKKSGQLTATELAGLMAPPVGDPAVPGLPQGAARRIAPTEAIAREGRLLGVSNISGKERPVALSYDYVNRNTIFIGGIGSGKSVGMANNTSDDMRRDMGIIVIDASASDSEQSLYSRVKGLVPDNRVDDVIDIHVRNNAEFPVGFDLFKQGLGLSVIDQITDVFTGLYPDIAKGVTVRELLFHGIWTLTEANLNLIDLEPLLRPKASELDWAKNVVAKLNDPELKEFWTRMREAGWSATDMAKRTKWVQYTDPLYRRLWQLVGRPEIRHMVGQATDTGLNWERALKGNKIVLISLAGLPPETAQLLANLLVQSLWTTAQRFDGTNLRNPNALYMDEFQVSASIKGILEDLLARGRKHLIPTTLGTQYISGLPDGIKAAVLNNVMNRIIYPLKSNKEADIWCKNLGTDKLTDWDLQNGRPFEPVVQLETATGSQIVTIKADPEREQTGNAKQVEARSRATYSTPVAEVREQIAKRRSVTVTKPGGPTKKPVGPTPYTMDPDEFNELGK